MEQALKQIQDFTKQCLTYSPAFTGSITFNFVKGEYKNCKKEQHFYPPRDSE